MKPRWVIFDIDGTLSDDSARVKLSRMRKYDEYHSLMALDPPRRAECTLLCLLSMAQPLMCIALVTGRPERFRGETWAWMERNGLRPHISELYMRQPGDRRPNESMKEAIWEEHFHDRDVLFVVEDNPRSVVMWRSLGLTCFQTHGGEGV